MVVPSESTSVQTARHLAICADDFGMDPAVDDAIVELARQGRLTATSVLTDAVAPRDAIDRIAAQPIDLGLHLNLTQVLGSLSSKDVLPLGQLMVRSHLRLLPEVWIRDHIERQLDHFEAWFGRSPDYVDGHLHIHQLPQIRDALVNALARRDLPAGFWIRDTRPVSLAHAPFSERFKAWVVGHLGMSALAQQAGAHGWSSNQGFFGVYDFTAAHRPFAQMLKQWLSVAGQGALLMTHPSTGALPGDPIGQSRVAEYTELSSEHFGELLVQQDIKLVRLSQLMSSLP